MNPSLKTNHQLADPAETTPAFIYNIPFPCEHQREKVR